jgi:HAD superfamily hydrolase (TIGR01509 family)
MIADPGPGPVRPARSAGLDRVTEHWQAALDAAQSALRAAAHDLPPDELGRRQRALGLEEAATAQALENVAREAHVDPLPHLFFGSVSPYMLGLPPAVQVCIFELDGVLAGSGAAHRIAWAETLNEFLLRRFELTGQEVVLFDPHGDYLSHIDGRPRLEGVLEFLASRGISLATGEPDDPPGVDTVHGLANRKNAALQSRLAREGLSALAGSRRYLAAARRAGLRRAVVSASANTEAILELTGLASLIDARIDGETIINERLRVRPEPDTLLAACRQLGVEPERVAVFENSPVGIEAGRVGAFGFVVGVDGGGQAEAMLQHGADRVVSDLNSLLGRGLAD